MSAEQMSDAEMRDIQQQQAEHAELRKAIRKENTSDVIDDRMDRVQEILSELDALPDEMELDVEYDNSVNKGEKSIFRMKAGQVKFELNTFLEMAVRKYNMSKYTIPNSWKQVEE